MKFIAIFLISLGLALAGAGIYVNLQFSPTESDATTGKVHQRSHRGTLVYLTQNEALVDDWAFGSGAILWLVGGYLLQRTHAKGGDGFPGT